MTLDPLPKLSVRGLPVRHCRKHERVGIGAKLRDAFPFAIGTRILLRRILCIWLARLGFGALGHVRSQFGGRVEVSAAGFTTEGAASRTGW
jgi:hypothetical protein